MHSTLPPRAASPCDPSTAASLQAGTAPRKRVLIVDDEPLMLHALTRLLDPYFHVTTAPNAVLALELLDATPIDLVLTDFAMPARVGTTGRWLLERVRDRWPGVVRVLMSGDAPSTLASDLASGLFARFLSKPCTEAELFAALSLPR